MNAPWTTGTIKESSLIPSPVDIKRILDVEILSILRLDWPDPFMDNFLIYIFLEIRISHQNSVYGPDYSALAPGI